MEWKQTIGLRAFGLAKVPVLFFVSPTVEKMTPNQCVVKIPLNYRTRNHLNCMYFAVLAAGADCAGALIALHAINKSRRRVDLIFKDFTADFHKRAEADVHFTCADGAAVRKQVAEAIKTGKRINRLVTVVATTPKLTGDTPVATFKLTLSVKLRQPQNEAKTTVKKTTQKKTSNKVVRLQPKRKKPGRRKAAQKKVYKRPVRHK